MDLAVEQETVQFTFLDFASQQVYNYTHKLFFKSDFLYLALVAPSENDVLVAPLDSDRGNSTFNGQLNELTGFLKNIDDCTINAKVLLVPSRAGVADLDPEYENEIKSGHKICKTIPVNARTGFGFKELKKNLVEYASLNKTKMMRRGSFEKKLQEIFDELAKVDNFALTRDELMTVLNERGIVLGDEDFDFALDIFAHQGSIFKLSNGHVVLRPHKLVDVLACVVTASDKTKSRIGEAAEGILNHDEKSLWNIWGSQGYSEELYLPTDIENPSSSPFLKLLYDSGLAYRLFDNKGEPLDKSLVPAMLKDLCAILKDLSSEESQDPAKLFCAFFLTSGTEIHVEVLDMKFKFLPSNFIALLQVRLQFIAVCGGIWKKGCALLPARAVEDKDKWSKEGTVLYIPDDEPNTLRVVISGKVRLTRSNRFFD